MALSDELLRIRLRLEGAELTERGLKGVRDETGKLRDSQGRYAKAADKAERSNRRFAKSFSNVGRNVKIGAAAVGGLAVLEIPRLINAYRESYKVGRQTNAVLKSTGGTANVTSASLQDLSNTLSLKTGIDDEQIQSMGNMLLTFTAIRNEAGKNNDVFNQTTQATLDLAKATGTDLTGAAKQVGKALNDPATGLTALRRSGASFSEDQTDVIKKLFETGHQMEAQKMILRELDKEFGGSAVAQGDPFDKLQVAIENVEESMGQALFPLFSKIADEAEVQFGRISKILDDPKLSGDQKFNQVLTVIEQTLNKGIDQFTAHIPEIANVGARVGLHLAIGVAKGFLHAPILGKLFVGLWALHAMGGTGALLKFGGKAGLKLGAGLGIAFLKTVAPYFAADIASYGLGAAIWGKLPALKGVFAKVGSRTGLAFGLAFLAFGLSDKGVRDGIQKWTAEVGSVIANGLIAAVNAAITGINAVLDKANVLGKLGVDAPNIGLVGNVSPEQFDQATGGGILGDPLPKSTWNHGVSSKPPIAFPGAKHRSKGLSKVAGLSLVPNLNTTIGGAVGAGVRSINLTVVSQLDGETVAENTTTHVMDAQAFA